MEMGETSKITPLLVRLYDSHKLASLANEDNPDARIMLATSISDLFDVNDLSVREQDLISDILTSLLRQAEIDLRQALAAHIAAMDNVPERIAHQIAHDDIRVAESFLRQSPVLQDKDLLYIIQSKDKHYWKAIAARETMGDRVINALADTKNLETAVTLAENKNITLTSHSMNVLSDMAKNHETLATPLLHRDEVTPDLAAKLYEYVGEQLKSYILENYPLQSKTLNQNVDDIVLELADTQDEYTPTPAMLKAADRYREKGILTVKLMLGTLRRGQFPSFIAQLSRFTGLSPEVVQEILMQTNGQGLAVACKAFEIVKADFVSIYLLTHRIRSEGQMVDMKDMKQAVEYYTRITREMAQEIIRESRDNSSLH